MRSSLQILDWKRQVIFNLKLSQRKSLNICCDRDTQSHYQVKDYNLLNVCGQIDTFENEPGGIQIQCKYTLIKEHVNVQIIRFFCQNLNKISLSNLFSLQTKTMSIFSKEFC